MDALRTDRNLRWIESLKPVLQHRRTFIAVGVMHLPGPDGLIDLFSRAGYTVTAVR
jgi:uncharacterized protein YbaP (TraB family)